ncbi:MAG: DUF3887 domain-containing protein [Xanthomonadales bacterium]|nr:DUF3887 domain-containing protein [Xanthomonadales bacterium]
MRRPRPTLLPVLLCMLALPGLAAAAAVDAELREERVAALLDAFAQGRVEDAGAHFDDRMRAGLPPARLSEVREALSAQLGQVRGRGLARHGCSEGVATVWQQVDFERGALDARVGFDDEGRISGFFLVPPQQATPCPGAAPAPDSADDAATLPAGVRELPVTVDAGDWPLPGRLTLPAGPGPFPAVVLVHGSGPNDADQTVFARAPFRDLAHGLALRGIASLRYDKRTRVHPARLQARHPDLTLDHEVVDDAVAALVLLTDRPEIDVARRVVVGLSLGALMAPRIARRAQDARNAPAGVALLAAPSRPLQWIVVAQVEYLAAQQGIADTQIAELRRQAARIDALAAGHDPGAEPLMLGLPAAWWRDLAGYDAVATARDLGLPIFIGHGGRDFQVTDADLAGWQSGLAGHELLTVRTWPALDHLLGAGEGPSYPGDYQRGAPVAAEAIEDLAAWIAGLPAAR